MKFAPSRRKSIRYSIFIGVLAGSVFSGSGALAVERTPIRNQTELENIGSDSFSLDGDYVLAWADPATPLGAPASGFTYVGGDFTGTFTGNGGTLTGLTAPLFDIISGDVMDLNLATEIVNGVTGGGALSNTLNTTGKVDNVTVTGNVTGGAEVGGLVGSSSGTITNSSMNGEVNGDYRVGGLVGVLSTGGTITGSQATGDVTSTSNGDRVGGLVGWADGNISSSSAEGNVSGGRWDVGGLVGYSSGDIANSHATGDVSGEDRVGGLVGQSDGDITFSSAKGEVTSTAVNAAGNGVHGDLALNGNNGIGGLVGYNTGNITSSSTGEADIDSPIPSGAVTGLKNVGGLVGFSSGNITISRATGDVNESWSCIMGETYEPCFEYIGGLVGRSTGEITTSWASGNVGGQDYVGGLVGKSEGNITNSYAAGYVGGNRYVGGLAGQSTGVITNGETYADKFLEPDYVYGNEFVGGLVGYSEGNVIDSVSRVPVSGGRYVGGLVGKSEGNITNSVAEGEVGGTISEVGGLVGYSVGDITDSSATGDVSGFGMGGPTDYIGGLVGYLEGVIKNSFATGSVSGRDNVGGLVGSLFQGLPWLDEYSDLNALETNYATNSITPEIGDINLVQGDFYIWDGDDWRKIFNISGSYAEGDVTGRSYVGGLVGSSSLETTITDSYAMGVVIGEGEYIGGFIGDAGYVSKISNSHATGAVTGTGEFEHGVGGFAGYLSGSLNNTYATGNVNGFDEVGGLVGSTGAGVSVSITNSYATGDVTGDDDLGGLVGLLDISHIIINSYATGDVTGDDDLGGLVGSLQYGATITNSYATGNVIGKVEDNGGDIGGLVGFSLGLVRNSHATGDVTGVFDVGGLVGDLQPSGEIRNSYATGTVSANGSDGGWRNGWGGLVGEFSGLIENSFATGNVVADYNAGALVGYSYAQEEEVTPEIINSFATGEVFGANNDVVFGEESIAPEDWQQGLGGFVGCKELYDIETSAYSCDLSGKEFSPLNQETILSVVNSAAIGFEEEVPAFEIVACKNNGLPLLSILDDSYANTCTTNPPAASVSAVLASVVQLNPKFNLLESTTLRLFLYLAGDDTIRITVEDFVVLGVTGVNKANLPVLLKLLKDIDLFTLDLKTINKNVKIADELLKKKKKK